MKNLKKINRKLFQFNNKPFSIIHNYHSPYQLFSYGRVVEFDDQISEYNVYVQAFLTKRWTHKKEITPKIKIINPIQGYRYALYSQQSYIINVLYLIDQLKYMKSIGNTDTGYWISCFFEDYEKNVIDAVLEKVLISGRVVNLDDIEEYDKQRKKANDLYRIFYEGDRLTPFEREIERMYLLLKQEKFNLHNNVEENNENVKLKKSRVYISYSEANKIQGHINFRMNHPSYFFRASPKFEKVDLTLMFNALYEVRYYSTNNILTRLRLMFQYRDSLLKSPSRVRFIAKYLFLQVYQYTDSYEFLNCFKLGLNFKESFYLIIMHMWLIIQRLKEFEENKNYADHLINELIDSIDSYGKENFYKFQFLDGSNKKKLTNLKFYIQKILDSYTFYFKINPITSENPFYYLNFLINTNIFSNSKELDDKQLLKLSLYFLEHYNYLKTKNYDDFEKNNFNFSVCRIPINYSAFFERHSSLSREKMLQVLDSTEENKIRLISNFKLKKDFLIFKYGFFIFKYFNKRNIGKTIDYLCHSYIKLPSESNLHYRNVDFTKSWAYKLAMFNRRELNPAYYDTIGKNEEKMKIEQKKTKSIAWKKEMKLGLSEIGKFEERSKKYREKMKDHTFN